jgi:hypothetical protein
MRNLLVVVIACLVITACQTRQTPEDLSIISGRVEGDSTTIDTVDFATSNFNLRVNKPPQWESFKTETGIVIGERFGSVATAGVLEGLMTYIFVSPLEDFTIDTASNTNIAQLALDQILADPSYTATIAYTQTTGFDWNGYDAAYYLITGEDGNSTIVIGVAFPGERALLSSSISAPYQQRDRIRQTLPELLDGLRFNEIVLEGEVLQTLPDPLEFPAPA